MQSNEQSRRASGLAMQNGRRAAGHAMEASRRAIADTNRVQRSGQQVANDISRLTAPPVERKTLRPIAPVGPLPPSQGRGVYKAPPAATGGIASPLVEDTTVVNGATVPDREYWPGGLLSSDGLFVLPAIKTLNLTDANGAPVQIQLAAPGGQ